MRGINSVLKVCLISCISLFLLAGCDGSEMYNKFIEQGKLAVVNQEYDRAQASFELALEAKDTDEVNNMLSEVENYLSGLEAKENGDFEEALKHFNKILEGDRVWSTIVKDAEEWVLELEEHKDQQFTYRDQLTEAERLFEEADYKASKEILNKLLEETNDKAHFAGVHQEAKDMLNQVNAAVEEAEKQRAAEEARKKEEAEKQRAAKEEAKLKAEAKKQKEAEEKEKNQATGEKDRMIKVAEDALGTQALSYTELYHNGELYYHFRTIDYPIVQIIIGQDGTFYDAYTYNVDGILEEL